VVTDVVRPRVEWVPRPALSLGSEAVAFARRVGMTLDPEQEFILECSLGVREDGRWQTREVGVNVPRQNGKGEVLIARELFGLFELGERLVIHTAHEFKTSAEHFQRLESVVRECPELHARVKRSERRGGLWGIGIRMVRSRSRFRMVRGLSSRRGRSLGCVVSRVCICWCWMRR
jgi:hypothetical protein